MAGRARTSLRFRLGLVTAAVAAAAVMLTGPALIRLAARDQLDLLDDELARRARVSARVVAIAVNNGRSGDVGDDLLEGAGITVRVVSGGEVLWKAGQERASDLPVSLTTGFRTVRVDRERWRVHTERLVDLTPLFARDDDMLLEIASSFDPVDDSLAALRRRLLLVGLVAVPLAGLAGAWAAGLALGPLRRLRATAEQIATTGDLTTRAPEDAPEELAAVARSLNAMLDALHRADTERQAAHDAARGFTASVAHELRTPLTSLRANLDVLAAGDRLTAEQRSDVLVELRAEEERLASLFEALEALARGELSAGRLDDSVDLAEVIDAAVERTLRRHPAARVRFHAPADPVNCLGWGEGLRVLVDNLLTNAAVHGARTPGGPVAVDVTLAESGRWLFLTVDDDGRGVPEAERDRVFEAFLRGAGTQAPGVGLGLALVAQQVRLHGGSVAITDSPSGGARVQVALPTRPQTLLVRNAGRYAAGVSVTVYPRAWSLVVRRRVSVRVLRRAK